MSTTELVPHHETESPMVLLEHAPKAVLAEAQRAAAALADVLKNKPKPVIMNGEQYLEFEDWQTAGRFYGITAGLEDDPTYVEFGSVRGFKSTAVALYRGQVISRATAYCLSDEEKWGARPKYEWQYVTTDGELSAEDPGRDRIVWEDNPKNPGKKRPKRERVLVGEETVPLFQLSSMSQTRACAKVLRNVLSWVVVLAGYKATPAEELPVERASRAGHSNEEGDEPRSERRSSTPTSQLDEQVSTSRGAVPQHEALPPRRPEQPRHVSQGSGSRLPKWDKPCPRCKTKGAVIISKKRPGSYHCWPSHPDVEGCGYDFTPEDAQIHEGAAEERKRSTSSARVRDDFDGPQE